MNREELVRVVLWQFAAIVVTALVSWIGFGSGAGLSAMFGGLCVAVPNAMFALYLLRSLGSKKPVAPALILLGELLKIFVICVLFALTAKFFTDLNWPAMLAGIIAGVFGLATRLYGITFRENKDIPVFHPDVKAYEVYDNDGSYLAVLYADFHPRESKQSGAWMTSFKDQWMEDDGTNSRPHISITTNFTKPTPNKPALLTLEEVETFLHEFGHALHGMFANTRYASMSGTSVYRDFVELPSQIMENFAIEKEFLHTFARHYQTGELLPDEYVERIIRASNFNVAYACLRQVSFGLLDMAWYTRHEDFDGDVRAYEQEAWAKAQLLPVVPGTCMSVQFSHIMDGGYSAGYYSYKWAEVLDADAFSVFKQKGIFNREVAASFRERILSKGGTEHPMVLYRRFRGQEPTIEALLRRNGIITGDK